MGDSGMRRRVTFADSKGFTLTEVKYLFESSNDPPQSFIDGDSLYEAMKNLQLTASERASRTNQNKGNDDSSLSNKFTLEFTQPFASYSTFRNKINTEMVSLENCTVECSGLLSGTIKVKNIAFDKQVHIRITTDQWATFVDRACQHSSAASNNDPNFDTFEFNINDLARGEIRSTSAHFCIRYTCAGQDYWDNNDGRNYTININQSGMQQRQQAYTSNLKPAYQSLQSTPTTYIELPTPQDSIWAKIDCSPFY